MARLSHKSGAIDSFELKLTIKERKMKNSVKNLYQALYLASEIMIIVMLYFGVMCSISWI